MDFLISIFLFIFFFVLVVTKLHSCVILILEEGLYLGIQKFFNQTYPPYHLRKLTRGLIRVYGVWTIVFIELSIAVVAAVVFRIFIY